MQYWVYNGMLPILSCFKQTDSHANDSVANDAQRRCDVLYSWKEVELPDLEGIGNNDSTPDALLTLIREATYLTWTFWMLP